MRRLWTIEALMDALSHPRQLSPLLAHTYHPIEPIQFNYRIERNLIRIPLTDGTKRWILTMPLDGFFRVSEHEIRTKCLLATQNSRMFAEAHYIRSAVTLFDNNGKTHPLPALLQEEAQPISEFLRLNYSTQKVGCLRRALESVALAAATLFHKSLSHNNLSCHNIGFDKACCLKISDLPIARGDTDDMEQLAKTAALIYITASDKDAHKILATKSHCIEEHEKRLRAILATAEHYAIQPLVRLMDNIIHNGSQEEKVTLLAELAAEPFHPLPLLTALLAGSAPSHTPLPNNTEQHPMVDFALCEELLPAGEGLVRYRMRGLWGYARTNGERLPLERILLYAEEFQKGQAVIKTARGYGLMNTNGRMVMNDVWDDLGWHPEEGVVTAADKSGKWRIYDSLGRQLSTVACDWMGSVAEGYVVGRCGNKYGYFSTSGTKLTNFIYDEAYSFHNGIALVCFKGSHYHIDHTFHRLSHHEEEFIQRFRGLKVGK